VLSGVVIGVVAASYLLNMQFQYRWLVWIIGIAFGAVALLLIIWPVFLRGRLGDAPEGKLRAVLILAIPIAFVLDSQICGLGLKACSTLCNAFSFTLISLGVLIAVQLLRGKSVGLLLLPMVVIALIPHCTCGAPINTIWQSILNGYAPTCQVIPLATTLFAVAAMRGVRTRWSVALVFLLLAVTIFIVVGNPLWGFPWVGCVG